MRLASGSTQVTLPDFCVIGTQRAGTTSLFYWLKQHPEIFLAPGKETNFFAFADSPRWPFEQSTGFWKHSITTLEEYARILGGARPGQLVGDVSPSYLYRFRQTVGAMQRLYGDALEALRIVVVLRDPAERAWSAYSSARIDGEETLSFEEALEPRTRARRVAAGAFHLDYVGFGRYHQPLRWYLEHFPKLKIVFFEELVEAPTRTLGQICEFLGVASDLLPHDTATRHHMSGRPRNAFAARLWDLLSRESATKNAMKGLVPGDARNELRSRLRHALLVRDRLRPKVRSELIQRFFADDLARLRELLALEGSRIDCWLRT